MKRVRDEARLKEYEAELVEAVLDGDTTEVDALRGIVVAFRNALNIGERAPASASARKRTRKRPGGPVGLKEALRELLQDRGRLTSDEAVRAVEQMPRFADSMPNRNTIVSRLGDLVREGEAESEERGVYVPRHDETDSATLPGEPFTLSAELPKATRPDPAQGEP